MIQFTPTQPSSTHELVKLRDHTIQSLKKSLASCLIVHKRNLEIHQFRQQRRQSIISPINSTDTPSLKNSFHDNYLLLDKIGEGANGIVKKCLHKQSSKQYAVKVMRMEAEHVYFLKTNFCDILKLKHPNIVKYKAIYFDYKKNTCYLVMELVNLPSISECKITSEQELKQVFQQIFDCLAYLHEKYICHRDIKPENILYDAKSKNIKIIDFGVAKNTKLRGRYQQMLTVTGTQQYRAPCMYEGGGYTESVDVWAAGIMLYKLITGKTPFEDMYHHKTIENIKHAEIDFKLQAFENYSLSVMDLISRLLKKNRKERLTASAAGEHVWFTNSNKHHLLTQSVRYNINLSESIQMNFTPPYRKSQQNCTPYLKESLQFIKDTSENQGNKVVLMKKWINEIKEDDQCKSNMDAQSNHHLDITEDDETIEEDQIINFGKKEIQNPLGIKEVKSISLSRQLSNEVYIIKESKKHRS